MANHDNSSHLEDHSDLCGWWSGSSHCAHHYHRQTGQTLSGQTEPEDIQEKYVAYIHVKIIVRHVSVKKVMVPLSRNSLFFQCKV